MPQRSKMNRRKFLKFSGGGLLAAVGGSLLGACQTAAPTAVPTVAPTAVPTSAPVATVAPAPAAKIGGSVRFMSFEGYDLPDCMKAWNTAHGVTFASTYIGDQNEVQAKLAMSQGSTYDLITYFQGVSTLFRDDLKIIKPLDSHQLPNRKDMYELFRTNELWVKDGQVWGVPFTWGIEGCNYNADKTSAPQAWKDYLKPEYKGKIGMIDEVFSNVIIAGRCIGLADTLPNLTQAQLDDIKSFLISIKRQARGIAPSYGDLTDLFVSGEIIATFAGWAAVNVWAQARNTNVQFTLPAEGGYTFVDAFSLPAKAENTETVQAWINEALSPEVQACQAKALAAGVVNPKAIPLLDKSVASLYDYNHIDELFKNAPLYTLPPSKSNKYMPNEKWQSMWEEVKAA
jgi:spermidine/putrescine transport system substrate-binding protein